MKPISEALNNKDRIKFAFSRAANNYDTLALFQKEVAEELINFVFQNPHPTSLISHPSILDIGCGTGFLTYGLAEKFPCANIFGVDISHSMIKVARGKMGGGKWEVGSGRCHKKPYFFATDGSVLPYKNATFDIAASNLTYQWIDNLEGSFREAYRVLKPGSVFIFSTLGPRTLQELKSCYTEATERFNKDGLPPFINFSGQETIISALKDAGFDNISITAKDCIRTYHNMLELLKSIKFIGAGNPFKEGDKSLARGSILKKMAEVYEQVFSIQCSVFSENTSLALTHHSPLTTDHCIYATYEVMFVYGKK